MARKITMNGHFRKSVAEVFILLVKVVISFENKCC